ncbi:MAG TPA: cobalamin-dependent protein [Acidimicrobiales bacterium]|nr:cobalamin-dependent protein [Acidimicrobiales bacterium]
MRRPASDRPLLHLIFPRWQGTGLHLTFGHRMPPMALLVLAALARRQGWRAVVIDENFERIPAERPDLAVLTVWTPLAARAYAIADDYRAKGVPVVLGGVHPSLLPTEALRHADGVVCGEAETAFATVLADAAAMRLKPLYQGEWQGMDKVPGAEEWSDIVASWPITRYAPMNTLQTTRGCRFNCDFCSVIRINGRGSRHRDPDHVVEELRVLKRVGQHVGDFSYVFLLDDDLAADLAYTEELCETIVSSGVKVTWGAQASIGLARNTSLLDLAVRSGCRVLFTGFESVSREALIECNKKNRPGEYGELVANLHRRGVGVEGGFIFGFDHDEPSVFQDTVEFVDRIEVDVAHFSILTPYPGTHTYARMLDQDRITSFDWSRYNLYNTVITPERMTAQQLDEGLRQAYRWFYARPRRARRLVREMRRRDPRFNIALGAAGSGYARHYRRRPMTCGAGYEAAPDDIRELLAASSAPAQEAVNIAFTSGAARLPKAPTPA